MSEIKHWPREVWIGWDGRRSVAEVDALAMRDLYIEENNERARLAEQLAGAVDVERIERVLRKHFGHLIGSDDYMRRAALEVADPEGGR